MGLFLFDMVLQDESRKTQIRTRSRADWPRSSTEENKFSGLQAENAHRTKSAYLSPFRKPKKEGDRNNNMSDGNCTV